MTRTLFRYLTLVFCLWLSAATAAPAAINCDAAADRSRPVEQAICAQPTLAKLNAHLNRAVAAQRADKPSTAASLKTDQANWQAETLSIAWAAMAHDDAPDLATPLASRYRQRLAYIAHMAVAPRRADTAAASSEDSGTPAAEIVRILSALEPGADPARHLANTSAGLSQTRYDTPAAARQALAEAHSAGASAALNQSINALDQAPVRLDWLAAPQLGLITQMQGSAHCPVTVLFRQTDDATLERINNPLDTALADGQGCGKTVALLSLAGQPVLTAIGQTSVDEIDVDIYPVSGRDQTQPQRVIARYDHGLELDDVLHRDDSNAGFWRRLAAPTARAFDQRPVPGFTRAALSPANSARIDGARAQVLAQAGADGAVAAPLSQAGDNTLAPFDHFSPSAVFFPIAARGNWVLGRIGHGQVGWREDNDWLMGFWGLDADDSLVPLASLRVERRRSAALGQAVVNIPEAL
ncbi:hypothetical protein [uncultured Salinisphaera sp.]|uniref:hypothetical protein n=1 Tax=uncultured Salinisphaera sp. TaxID=359372 RepID=UPI0032B0F4D1